MKPVESFAGIPVTAVFATIVRTWALPARTAPGGFRATPGSNPYDAIVPDCNEVSTVASCRAHAMQGNGAWESRPNLTGTRLPFAPFADNFRVSVRLDGRIGPDVAPNRLAHGSGCREAQF